MNTDNLSPVLLIAGTRPEGIKLAPVYQELKKQSIPVIYCATSQHTSMLKQVNSLFGIVPDVDLNCMLPGQDLFHITQKVLLSCKEVIEKYKPSCVVVQGDTTSAMAGALAAFYKHVPIVHIEAGLRMSSVYEPFPEELNRRMISVMATLHCCPTLLAKQRLMQEGKSVESLVYSGNTVVDALLYIKSKIDQHKICIQSRLHNLIKVAREQSRLIVTFTFHRRESLLKGRLADVYKALIDFAKDNKHVDIVYPIHPNPIIKNMIKACNLPSYDNIHLFDPLAYHELVYVLCASSFVVTDSGGLIEEAASLGKKTFILRDQTERMEAVHLGVAQLVGTRYSTILGYLSEYVLQQKPQSVYNVHLFGDGKAACKIVCALRGLVSQYRTSKNEMQARVI